MFTVLMIMRSVAYFTYTLLDCLILYTFLRLSNKVEGQRVAQIKQTLSNSIRQEDISDEEEERLRFLRRHTEY